MPSTFLSPSAAALRNGDLVFSSPMASDASSEAPSSLISFYSPVNIPVADDSNDSMACVVGISQPFKVYSPGGFLYADSYLDVVHAPRFEYQRNLGAGPRTHFSILGAHYDRREEYIDRLPHDSPFRQDLAMWFIYEETADCLLGGEPVCLPITLYAYWRDSDLSFTEVYAAVRGFGFPFRYLIGPRLKTGVLCCAFRNMVNRFEVGFSDNEVGPDGKSLVATDFLVDRHSKQKFMHTLSRNMIEEDAFLLWLKPSSRYYLWSKSFTDFCSAFILSSDTTSNVWAVDMKSRLHWAYYDLPRLLASVEEEFGVIGTSGYYEGMVRWFCG
ncbi:hypothetical protein BT96DRAFT_1006310 [Gymnopus androsaceus JB14]|uniref:Uncharacterized protein n=1 Tax=Gymnopus androsaceus JB14 TaxID=1447944 RepID=A0A6A4GL86_9AGAR|nr:hypothetical protein BT96DRAFT_1006310 [Gymnopus androsaceus JB14]